jgi:hypothetical protein
MTCEKERIQVFYGTQKVIKQKEMWMWDNFERADEDQQGENSKEQAGAV